MNSMLRLLDSKLRQFRIATAASKSDLLGQLSNQIYKVIFAGDLFRQIWDEPVLLGIAELISIKPPDQEIFAEKLRLIRQRTERVIQINDFFFKIIDSSVTADQLISVAVPLFNLPEDLQMKLRSDRALHDLPQVGPSPSERVDAVVKCIEAKTGNTVQVSDIRDCLLALKEREEAGSANVLLVDRQTNVGVMVTISVTLQPGSGAVNIVTPAEQTFEAAVKRARQALVHRNLLSDSQDIVLSAELTEAQYSGSSISLGAAVAAFSAARHYCLDRFTAFTGDINLGNNEWCIRRVDGIEAKLNAALRAGCRRVLIPRENEADIPNGLRHEIVVFPVSNMKEVLELLLLSQQPALRETLKDRKINLLKAECTRRGWHLSQPKAVQNGEQFSIVPPTGNDLKITIYDTGAHSPKTHASAEYGDLLDSLNQGELPTIAARSIQQVINVADTALRKEIQQHLAAMGKMEIKTEQYCDYSYAFKDGAEKLAVKQYSSGKLQIQGHAGPLYKRVLDVVVPRYNLHYPNSTISADALLATSPSNAAPVSKEVNRSRSPQEIEASFPYIGTDESGKGDYFGPLVVAAVWVDQALDTKLRQLGVKDSKELSDEKCQALAPRIRELLEGKYHEVEIPPDRYNELYDQLLREKKNLNHLLAWGHARALESTLARQASENAIADQFGDERYINSKLMDKGRTLHLIQTPKAERFTGVAAASVLARDRFLSRLNQMSKTSGILLPKGASPAVVDAARLIVQRLGSQALRNYSKLHFKTTQAVLSLR